MGFKHEAGHGLGVLQYEYGACELSSGQKQTLNGDEQQQVGGVMQGEIGRKFYLSVSGSPLTAGHSVSSIAPSYLYEVATGQYWREQGVYEQGKPRVTATHEIEDCRNQWGY